MKAVLARYGRYLFGSISGWDRLFFRGTIRWLSNFNGLMSFLTSRNILLKDFRDVALELTGRVRASCVAAAEGLPTIYLRSMHEDKEALARTIAREKGVRADGSVCMFSVIEPCLSPKVVGSRATRSLELRLLEQRCVWIYRYFDHPVLGWCHVRVCSWMPFTAHVCLNGRHWLERGLIRESIPYRKEGNTFRWIGDFARAQELMDEQLRTDWTGVLNGLLRTACPGLAGILGTGEALAHYWSADDTEWATDLAFRRREDLQRLYGDWLRHAWRVGEAPELLRFLAPREKGGGLQGGAPQQVETNVKNRQEGVRIKHLVEGNSIKMYDKAGTVLRTETTVNNPRRFKVYRRANDDPKAPMKWQRLRKGVADLHRRAQVSQRCNGRYLQALEQTNHPDPLAEVTASLGKPAGGQGRRARPLNPFAPEDQKLLLFLGRPEHALEGFRNADVRAELGDPREPAAAKALAARASHRIRILRAHGLVKKVVGTHRYLVTAKGSRIAIILAAALRSDVKELAKVAA